MRILRRPTLKPRTDLYVFIFREREFQTDDPENAKLIVYRSVRVRSETGFWLVPCRHSVRVTYMLRRPERERESNCVGEKETQKLTALASDLVLFLEVGDVAIFLCCSLKFKTEQTNKESLYQLLKMYLSRKSTFQEFIRTCVYCRFFFFNK